MMNPPPGLPERDQADRRLFLVVLSVSLAASFLLYLAEISREMLLFLLLGLSLSFILAWRGSLTFAGWFAPFAALLVLSALIFKNLGLRDSAMMGLPATIVAASLLNGRKGVIVFGLASLGVVTGLGVSEALGWVERGITIHNSLADYFTICVIIILISALLCAVISRLDEKKSRISRELAERQRAENALRESEAFRQRIFESSRMPIVVMESENYTYIDCNAAAIEIYGFSTRENTLGKTPFDVSTPLQQDGTPSDEKARFYTQKALREGSVVFEWRHQRPNQEIWDAEVHLMSFISGERQYLQFTLQDITYRKQTEEKLVSTVSQLATLNEIGRAVSQVTDLRAVLEITRQQLTKLLEFDFYSVRVFNAESGTVSYLAVYENGRYWDETDAPLVPGTDAYKVFETGESVLRLYTDDELEAHKRTPLMQIGDRSQFTASVIFSPLKKHGKTIGALSVQRNEPNAYKEEHLKLVDAVAIQVAIAIENARLFTHLQLELADRKQAEELTRKVNFEIQRRIKELYALNSVAQASASARNEYELLEPVVETLYSSLYPDIVGIALWDEQEGLLRAFPRAHRGIPEGITQMTFRPGEGIVGHVAATRQAYRMWSLDDPFYLSIDPSIRSELCVPILAGEKLLGILDIESRQPNAFSKADENLLVTVAGQLAAALERLRAEQQLRALNADLEQRVTDRTAQLEAANQELEAFSYSVSHDLRAPLRAVNGFAKILKEDFSDEISPMARNFLAKILDSGWRMGQLIDELLDFSRIGRKSLNTQPVRLNEIIQEVVESLAPEIAGRQIEWHIPALPPATADPLLLRQVYANLLGNAVKYTGKREAARIEVGSLTQNGETIYFVRDNGAGFDMQYADKLFGVFQRLHCEDEFEGVGIGLAIVRRIIERHGGRIWAEAQVDKGATFYFTFERAA